MSKRFTIQQLQELQASGTIKGFTQKPLENIPQKPARKIPVANKDAGSCNKLWLHSTLKGWCKAKGYLLIREHTFSEERDWRMDWAVFDGLNKIVAVEYEGIFSRKSRHTTQSGFTEDSDKYRAAALEGWKVLRYTAKNYKSLLDDLNQLL